MHSPLKTGCPGDTWELKDQFPMMHELVDAMNLAKFVVPGVEADDVMGTLAKAASGDAQACLGSIHG